MNARLSPKSGTNRDLFDISPDRGDESCYFASTNPGDYAEGEISATTGSKQRYWNPDPKPYPYPVLRKLILVRTLIRTETRQAQLDFDMLKDVADKAQHEVKSDN